MVVAAVVGATAVLLQTRARPNTVAAAVDTAQDEAKFDSSAEAGSTFASIASKLLDDTRACIAKHGDTFRPCEARSTAVAYAQGMAVASLTCTQPAIFEGREALLAYVRAIQRLDENPTAAAPEVPAVPRCG
jgi:hypothetical protein